MRYIRTRTRLCVSVRFTKYPHEPSFLLSARCQMCFLWSMIMTNSLCLQPTSRKCRMLSHKPFHSFFPFPTFLDVLFLRLTRNYTSVPEFVNPLVDVPLELYTFDRNLSFRSTVYTRNYEFRQISRACISMFNFSRHVARSLLFQSVDHRLKYLKLSLEKF